MIMIQPLFLSLCLFFGSDCSVGQRQPQESIQDIHSVTKEHFFSSRQTKDLFRIRLTGGNILEGRIKFEIITSSGEFIYSINFEAKLLLGYGLDTNSNDQQKSQYIIKRMNEFFLEENFITPAIESAEVYDKDYYGIIDKTQWNQIKNDEKSIAFYYLLAEGDQTWITFLKKEKKVIRYKICC